MNQTPLNGHAYLILGGSGGIGSALARRLVARGASVHLAARNEAPLAALAADLAAEFPGTGNLSLEALDATDPDAVRAAALNAKNRYGRLDGIANAVGSLLLKPAHRTSLAEFRAVIDQNLVTAFGAVAAAGEVINGPGSVVLFSSVAARIGLANHEAIAAAKAGVIGLALSAAATYGAKGLRINVVAPGLTATPLTAGITGNPLVAKASAAMHVLGRLGEADEPARAAEFLLDPQSAWITGQVLGVDGGLGSVRSRG
jgi:NAD(P)-dependent dehydrogenase (short-subunit alcohol dehydrogenase family)